MPRDDIRKSTSQITTTRRSVPKTRSRQFSRNDVTGGGGGGDDFEEWKRARQLHKPPDQIQLSDAELKEEVARVLTSTNTLIPKSLVEFNYAQGSFLPQPSPGNTVILCNIQGTTIHRETEEAKKQIADLGDNEVYEPDEDDKLDEGIEVTGPRDADFEGEGEEGDDGEEGEGEGADEAKGDEEDEPAPTAGGPKKKLTNQFNFCERAALTYNNPNRSQETQTIPPPVEDLSGLVLQWIIFDAYEEDYAFLQREKEKEKKVLIPAKKVATRTVKTNAEEEARQAKLFIAWKTLERMVNLNTYDDIAKDYRFWEDPSDEFRVEEGTLLPLWKFSYEKTKKSNITDIMWNPLYYDLFVVAFGTLEYKVPCQGAVCFFTLKNPSYPEHICLTESSVLCVDIHPKYPFMIVCGLYDGNVLIYNVTASCTIPQYRSKSVENKHSGLVWKVAWGPDLRDGEMNFYSCGSDGKINNWVLMLNELSLTNFINLSLPKPPICGPDGTFIKLTASMSCMVFHPEDPLIYLIGSEYGFIFKCSVLFSSTVVFKYEAHHMPVYDLDYNKFNSNIFISCGADWRIKVWEDERPGNKNYKTPEGNKVIQGHLERILFSLYTIAIRTPLFVFDVGAQIGGVKWAPYSSTVFAACTRKGKIYVFDLNINKYKAICKQNVVSKKKAILTRLCFNSKLPILIVGDDRGVTHTLKLSPNLRILCKAPKKQQHLDQYTLQCMKLDKLLALVQEPAVLTPPEDVEFVEED